MTLLFQRKINFFYIICIPFFVFSQACKEGEKKSEHGEFTNELINETSPYLLQHAHNPVYWKPWSNEALKEAEKEDKLIVISVGYSSCHWCHVMEKETFTDTTVAKVMNESFINIKVDREERPDIDHVYMTAAQLMTGKGGWPLNIIALPNGKPLYAGTYHTQKQWISVLENITKQYKNDPKKAYEYAEMVSTGVQDVYVIKPSADSELLTEKHLASGIDRWKFNWDYENGGFKGSQKFMLPGALDFILKNSFITSDKEAQIYLKETLNKMALGGVYDQLGGGFFRYSTDAYWKVPHFEKMLYDNAQLIGTYSNGYKVFKDPLYKEVVYNTISFLKAEMKSNEGGYFSALNADTEGEEGKFYLWKKAELENLITNDFKLFASYYSIEDKNADEEGNLVLMKSESDVDFMTTHKLSEEKLNNLKKDWNTQLLNARNNRVNPDIDDKMLTSWNALLIKGLVEAYKTFGDDEFLKEAISIHSFIKNKAYKNDELIHAYKKGSTRTDVFLEDYAFLIQASLALYEVTAEVDYLQFAQKLNKHTLNNYKDDATGMFRFNAKTDLLTKIIKTDDGVIPSPNAVMADNLFLLGHIEYNTEYMQLSKNMVATMVPNYEEAAASYWNWGSLLSNNANSFYEVAVVGENAKTLLKELNKEYLPNTLIVTSTTESDLPLFKGRYTADGTYIYVCQNNACLMPVDNVKEALKDINTY